MINLPDPNQLRDQYKSASPFPHIVLHDIVDPVVLDGVLGEFPKIREGKNSVRYNAPTEVKDVTCDRKVLGPVTNSLFDELNSPSFCAWLNQLTGIEETLVGDPLLWGGGLHETLPGGFLKLHADFNKHYGTGYDRRINILLYLNKDWKSEYGGNVELWDTELTKCEVSVEPRYNTMVIFNTTDFSYHGHPDPLKCPEGMSRKSIAMYYFSDGRPAHELNGKAHNSIFRPRAGVDQFEDMGV